MNSENLDKRRKALTNFINTKGVVSFADIKSQFPGISEVTLRKDLKALDAKKTIIRTHGGAKSMPLGLTYFYRTSVNQKLKEEIANKAVSLLKPGMTVFITAGTTCAEFAHHIPDIPLYIYSDGLYTITNMPASSNIHVELFGGAVDLKDMRIEGLSVLDKLQQTHFSYAFIGASGFNLTHGFSYYTPMTAATLNRAAMCADKVAVLLDSSKINDSFTSFNLPLSSVDVIVSDSNIDKGLVSKLNNMGIMVL